MNPPGTAAEPTPGCAARGSRVGVLLVFGLIISAYILLWSPYWYPGSDSGLYMSLARNMDEGHGYTYMGRPHRLVPPLTPLLLWAALQMSHSFGLCNAIMTVCMIGGFVLMYRTLRLWLDYRIALALTAASAMPYWQFRLGTMVLSEQPFFVLFWGALYCFARAYRASNRRTAWLIAATMLMLLGTGFRIASLPLAPMLIGALWLEYRGAMPIWPRRLALVCAVGGAFVLALGVYTAWGRQAQGASAPRELIPLKDFVETAKASNEAGGLEEAVPALDDSTGAFQTTQAQSRSVTRYSLVPRLAIRDIAKLPGLIGRWMAELLLAPSREAFKKLNEDWQAAFGSIITVLALVGLIRQARAHNWWVVLPILYMTIIAFMWGFRVIPRYLTPILPMVVLWISIGCGATAGVLARLLRWDPSQQKRLAARVLFGVPIAIVLVNLPLLAVEVYARHHGDFYENTRQGAWAELVDAAAVIRKDLPADTVICTNDPLLRREIHLLTGRAIAAPGVPLPVANPDDEPALRRFFQQTRASYAVIRFYENGWPEWHLKMKGPARPRTWWGLYKWDADQDQPVRITVPVDRTWVRELPDSTI